MPDYLLIFSKILSIPPPLLIIYFTDTHWVNQRIILVAVLHYIKASPSKKYVLAAEVLC